MDDVSARERFVNDVLAASAPARKLVEQRPEVLAAWLDPSFDYEGAGFHGPEFYAPHDDMEELLEDGIGAELLIAWRRIEADVKRGVDLDEAVNRWGVRGHPDFKQWFPVTPPPWGDAALVRRERERRSRGDPSN